MILLLKFVLAHIIGDFFLQPNSWVEHKKKLKLKSWRLYVHGICHILLLFIICWDFSRWYIYFLIGILHLVIDGTKLILQNEKNQRWMFFADQFLHLVVLVSAYLLLTNQEIRWSTYLNQETLTIITALAALTIPSSIVMKTIFSKWDLISVTNNHESLTDAGKYIGILERVLVFVFIMVGRWEAVGFLITAKSVFRFGDLKESKHRKLTEYILIGTLISFGIAIGTSLLVKAAV